MLKWHIDLISISGALHCAKNVLFKQPLWQVSVFGYCMMLY